jgi:histidyl-tRNA synthetase
MQGKALPGFRDFYPDDTALRNHIFAAWRTVAARYGFEEYDGPPLEPLELYTQKSGEEIVGQLYHFRDKGEREVALRPEMTPTLARMVGARAQALKKPIRWFSIPQLFRYERQQRGRKHEHFQLNMDIIGEVGAGADAEVMAAALDIMRALGLGAQQVRLRVSDRRVIVGELAGNLGVPRDKLEPVLGLLDRSERDTHWARHLGEILGASVAQPVVEFFEGLQQPDRASRLRQSADAEPLNEALSRLEAMGLGEFVDVDFRIVRGLAYYTGIVFELFDAGKQLRAICGGGRYDALMKDIGGVDLPCVGFGMGDVVLGELLQEHRPPPAAVPLAAFLVAVGGDDLATVLKLAHALRDRGVAVEYALKPQAIRKQLELAAARGAPRAVIIGPEERQSGIAVVKDLVGGVESKVPLGELVNVLGGR